MLKSVGDFDKWIINFEPNQTLFLTKICEIDSN